MYYTCLFADTDGAMATVESWFEMWKVNLAMVNWYLKVEPAPDCAAEIIRYTILRRRELNFPSNLTIVLAVLHKACPGFFEKHYDKVVLGQFQRLIGRE